MRLIARFPDQRQASALVDTLKNSGFDRKDMIISDLAKVKHFDTIEQAAENMIFVKSERNGLGEFETFASGIRGFEGKEGIIVAVELPKHSGNKVREMMEQSGAVEIIQD